MLDFKKKINSTLMKLSFILLFTLLQFTLTGQIQSITLSGHLINFPQKTYIQEISADVSINPLNNKILIPSDSSGKFSMTLNIQKNGYYRIGRNILFLTVGNDLSMMLNYTDPKAAIFHGTEMEANNYLKSTPFPKMGSFIDGGEEIKLTFDSTINHIMSIVQKKKTLLGTFKNVPPHFKIMEYARIKADLINSIISLNYYYTDVLPRNSFSVFKKELDTKSPLILKKYALNFFDSSYLSLEVYQDIVPTLIELSRSNTKNKIQRLAISDWLFTQKTIGKIAHEADKDTLTHLRNEIRKIKNKRYKEIVTAFQKNKLDFSNGKTAKDFTAITNDNKRVFLKDFIGKVIYIDLWATWCGPCLLEMPNFNKLKQQYKNNAEIVFLSISIDSERTKWKDYLQKVNAEGQQWIINRADLSDYFVIDIPRYIIIKKDFTVFDLNAPAPSASNIIKTLDSLIKE